MFRRFRRERDEPPDGAIRKLGFNEDGCVALGETVSFPVTFAVFLKSKTEITHEMMLKSLQAVTRKHPLLRVKVIKNSAGYRYYVPIDNWEGCLNLTTRKATDWHQIAAEAGDKKIDASAGPLWFADLLEMEELEGTEDKKSYVLIMVFNHAILDGKSGVFVMNDIVRNLNLAVDGCVDQDEAEILPIAPCMEEALPPEIQLGFFGFLKLLFVIAKLMRRGVNEYMKQYPARVQREPDVKIGTYFYDFSIPMAPLLERCRAEKVTVQGAVTAAAYIALLHVIRAKNPEITKIKMGSNYIADYRRFCRPVLAPDFMGFHAVASLLNPVEVTSNVSDPSYFWSIARRVTTEIHEYIGDQTRPIQMLRLASRLVSYESLGKKMPAQRARGERAADAFGVSNIGNVDPIMTAGQPGSSVEVTKVLWGTNGANICPPFMHFLMSVRGKLVWTLNWYSNISTEEEAEAYAKEIQEVLNRAIL
ncbi:uncharacterized protein LOC106175599 [Lingula anatina]|uniref:Uncharacterized protein LOC106175599 n=1 Tax=Lingula anatina TaxID=7574 RepID=A0A1S3JRT7_LINAN|nr:uncharacterized protein LOC106175599 [Lingula anatina]|eukprot:XP_013413128.1 uncharacterized protein LOC106175599 [Lingula anatina]